MTNDDVLGHTKETDGLIIIKINRKKNMKNDKSFLGGGWFVSYLSRWSVEKYLKT